MKRTTILADEDLMLEAKQLAEREGKSLTEVIREALAEYVAARRAHRNFPFVGMGNSENPDLAHQTEEILAAEVDPIDGWAPRQDDEQQKTDSSATATRSADPR